MKAWGDLSLQLNYSASLTAHSSPTGLFFFFVSWVVVTLFIAATRAPLRSRVEMSATVAKTATASFEKLHEMGVLVRYR